MFLGLDKPPYEEFEPGYVAEQGVLFPVGRRDAGTASSVKAMIDMVRQSGLNRPVKMEAAKV